MFCVPYNSLVLAWPEISKLVQLSRSLCLSKLNIDA